jgi:hypothetical protein
MREEKTKKHKQYLRFILFTDVGVYHSIPTSNQPAVVPSANSSLLYDVALALFAEVDILKDRE